MILCCGEALVDMIPSGAGMPPSFVPHTGGALFNSAIALGRLGVPCGLLSGVSRDLFGEMLVSSLRDNHVATDHLVRSDRLTTLAIVHLVNGSATYAFYDENSAGRTITINDVAPLPESVTALLFGGISLVAEPGADAYAALLAREKPGRVVMLDPNIRPGFITDEVTYRARLDAMIDQSHIIKTSDEDLDWLQPGSGSLRTQADAILARGPALVVVTKGADGATAYFAGGEVSVAAQTTDVVDTVGAGDTFNAGFLAGLQACDALSPKALVNVPIDAIRHGLELGAKAAAVTVSRAGANPPWASELAS